MGWVASAGLNTYWFVTDVARDAVRKGILARPGGSRAQGVGVADIESNGVREMFAARGNADADGQTVADALVGIQGPRALRPEDPTAEFAAGHERGVDALDCVQTTKHRRADESKRIDDPTDPFWRGQTPVDEHVHAWSIDATGL